MSWRYGPPQQSGRGRGGGGGGGGPPSRQGGRYEEVYYRRDVPPPTWSETHDDSGWGPPPPAPRGPPPSHYARAGPPPPGRYGGERGPPDPYGRYEQMPPDPYGHYPYGPYGGGGPNNQYYYNPRGPPPPPPHHDGYADYYGAPPSQAKEEEVKNDVSKNDPVANVLLGNFAAEEKEPFIREARLEALRSVGSRKLEFVNNSIRIMEGHGPRAFRCESCQIHLPSQIVVTEHIKSNSHKLNLSCKTLNISKEDKDLHAKFGEGPTKHKTLKDILDKNTLKIVGLRYVTEYKDSDRKREPVFGCMLCSSFHTRNTIMTHLSGYSHFYNFLLAAGDPNAELFQDRTAKTEVLLSSLKDRIAANYQQDEWNTSEEIPPFAQSSRLDKRQNESEEPVDQFIYSHLLSTTIDTDEDQTKVIKLITAMTARLVEFKMKEFPEHKTLVERIRQQGDPQNFSMVPK